MNIAKELLIEKAKEGYTVCYADTCPLRTHCLRWLVGQQMLHTYSAYRCVNPHFEGVATTECPMYRSDQKIRFAKGMTHTFTGDMPKRRTRSSQWHHSPVQPYLLFRVSQWLAPHFACFAREDPQVVPRQRLDGGGEVRQLCRGLRLVISLNRCLDIFQQIDAGFETDT